jgi:integrase
MPRGHLRKRGKRWSIVLDAGETEDGRRRQKWYSGFKTEKEASIKLTELLHQLDTGTYVQPSKETVATFLRRWLDDYARGNVAPRTFEGYEHIIRRHLIPTLGSIVLTKLTPQRIQAYYAEKGKSGTLTGHGILSPRTIRHHHVTLHGALQTAVRWGLLVRNPADAVTSPRFERRDMQTLDDDGLRSFLAVARSTQWYAPFYLSLFTGMRRSELLALRWDDVDLAIGRVSVNRSLHRLRDRSIVFRQPKTAKGRRMIALPPSATLVLAEHREQDVAHRILLGQPLITGADLVFARIDGSPIPPDSMTQAWASIAKKSGFVGLRLHDARHMHASLLLKQGVHPKIVQERLGHATIATTLDIYSHVAPGMQEAAALRFDSVLLAAGLETDESAGAETTVT